MRHGSTLMLALALVAAAAAGCRDNSSPTRVELPAAPRGVYSVTGDARVTLHWLGNTEHDLAGYRIYQSGCADPGCTYDRVGTVNATTDSFVVTGLHNGTTYFFAVAAYNTQNGESDLSYETTYDTPRPAGSGAVLANAAVGNAGAGWDFSAFAAVSGADTLADIVYTDAGGFKEIYAPNVWTDIQDAGYAGSLDHVDYAPSAGWSPTGSVEVVPGHCYIVWTRDNHYAKFRVTTAAHAAVVFDWAYQTAAGNGELVAHRTGRGAAAAHPVAAATR